jgi:hypothetical protein
MAKLCSTETVNPQVSLLAYRNYEIINVSFVLTAKLVVMVLHRNR